MEASTFQRSFSKSRDLLPGPRPQLASSTPAPGDDKDLQRKGPRQRLSAAPARPGTWEGTVLRWEGRSGAR